MAMFHGPARRGGTHGPGRQVLAAVLGGVLVSVSLLAVSEVDGSLSGAEPDLSAIGASLVSARAACATGQSGLGKAMKDALHAQLRLASASPDVSQYFNPASASSCFGDWSIMDIDLSVMIPDLAGLAQGFVDQLFKQAMGKVCTAINSTVADAIAPLNDALGKMNQGLDFNAMFVQGMSSELTRIDPALGQAFQPAQQLAPVRLSIFDGLNLRFDTGAGVRSGDGPSTGARIDPWLASAAQGASEQATAYTHQHQLARQALDNARQAWSHCEAVQGGGACTSEAQAYRDAAERMAQSAGNISQFQMSLGATAPVSATQAPAAPAAPAVGPPAPAAPAVGRVGSFF